jgi:chemotaxis regulatin CheY-phosphate phosphatase CheZ
MNDSDDGTTKASEHILTAVVKALEARRELAQQSVQILMDGLRSGNQGSIHMGLRGLGVPEDSQMYQKIGMMSEALHTLLHEFRTSLKDAEAAGSHSTGSLLNATESLQRVIFLSRDAARRTSELTADVAELLHQQEFALEIAREVLNDPRITEGERQARLNEFLDKQESCVTAIRVVNKEVLNTQSFRDMVSHVLERVITAIEGVEGQISDLKELCASEGESLARTRGGPVKEDETEIVELN